MIHTVPATLRLMALGSGRKLLMGRTTEAIPAGSTLVLTRIPDSEQYSLHAAQPDMGDQHDPSTLATFISPADVDAIQEAHALAVAIPEAKPKRKPRKRKAAGVAA